jgi:segregation and condensation protein B
MNKDNKQGYEDKNNHKVEEIIEGNSDNPNDTTSMEGMDNIEIDPIDYEDEDNQNSEDNIEGNSDNPTDAISMKGMDNIENKPIDNDTTKEEAPDSNKEDLDAQQKVINRALIEAALYASGKPLDIEELSTKLEIPKKDVDSLIQGLAFDYLERPTALIINQVGEKFQMALRTEYVERVAKFASGGGIAERYLRTLTIIALKQPILKSMVIKLRGSGAYEHIKYLLDNDLISAVKKGRSEELTTTDKYAEMFGLPKNREELKKVMIEQLGIEVEKS